MNARARSVEDIIDLVRGSRVPMTANEVATLLGCHWQTAHRKLEAGVHRHILIRDEYDEDGVRQPQPEWRYILDPM